MKNQRKKAHIDRILSAWDQVPPSSPKPFLMGRILTRMNSQKQDVQLRPVQAVVWSVAVALILITNLLFLFNDPVVEVFDGGNFEESGLFYNDFRLYEP